MNGLTQRHKLPALRGWNTARAFKPDANGNRQQRRAAKKIVRKATK